MDINIGILGCAKIVYNAVIIPVWQSQRVKVHGIASRSFEKAESYALRCKIPHVFKSYDDLLKCNEIDSVYIALPNHLHKEMIISAAEHKKHILVEKPVCINTGEFQSVKSACEKNGVHLLEGLMVQHHPWQSCISQYIQNRRLGCLKKIDTKISFIPKYDINDNYRAHPEYGGGSFYDLAPYWIQFVQSILGLDTVSFEGKSDFSGPNSCDFTFSAKMRFGKDIEANFLASFEMPYEASHEILFEKGSIKIENFFRANMGKHKMSLNIEDRESGTAEEVGFPPQNYYINQLEFFSDVIKGDRKNIDIDESGERVKMMEAIYNNAKGRFSLSGVKN